MKLSLEWFSGLKPAAKNELKSQVIGSRNVLERLSEILEGRLKASQTASWRKTTYEMPAWSEYQADQLGEQRTLQSIIDLVTLTEE